ncbi:MAG: hypothetical protein AAFX93_20380 [Verrucomicrobiota bacterium]
MSSEPETIRAKTSLSWQRVIADYSADDGYVARYEFRSASGSFNIDASGSGKIYTVAETPTVTAAYSAGDYLWNLFILKGVDLDNPDERHWIGCGNATVIADSSANTTFDARSLVKKTLDAIEEVINGKASKDVQEYSIQTGSGARALKHIPITELLMLRDKYAALYAAEQARAGKRRPIIKPKFNNR